MGEDDDLAPSQYGAWKPFFAWYPVRLRTDRMVWFEKIFRRQDRSFQTVFNPSKRWMDGIKLVVFPYLSKIHQYDDLFGILSEPEGDVGWVVDLDAGTFRAVRILQQKAIAKARSI